MSAKKIVFSATLAAVLLFASGAFAQEEPVTHHEISAQGTGFFTKDSQSNGTSQHSTDTLGVTLPSHSRVNPYVLAGTGALVFDPTGNAGQSVPGAIRQAKAAFV